MNKTLALVLLIVLASVSLTIAANPVAGSSPSATLAWNADTMTVSGYKLYFGAATGSYGTPVDVGNVLTYTLTTLPATGPAYIAATAYLAATSSSAYQESGYSLELVLWGITASSDANSTITPSGSFWQSAGASQTFTITPKPGYTSVVNLDGALVGTVTSGSYTLTNIGANHTISVVSMAQIPPPPKPTLVKGQ